MTATTTEINSKELLLKLSKKYSKNALAEKFIKIMMQKRYMKFHPTKPEFNHLKAVVKIISKYTKDKDIIIAAWLHDAVEDKYISYEQIEEYFGKTVVYLVYELTSDKTVVQIIGKAEYLKNKLNNMTNEALLIKLADRLDNVSDLDVADKQFKKYYKEQTLNILTKINRPLQPEHIAIMSKIHDYLNNY